MKHAIKIIWIALAIAVMLVGLKLMIFDLLTPIVNPSTDYFVHKIAGALICLITGSTIIVYVRHG